LGLRDHPYWVATQAHPEFKSRPDRAHPLFRELVAAALARRDATPPGLRSMLDEAVGERISAPAPSDAAS
jgi:CTP synthase